MKRVTLKDIAKMLSVSSSTVSRALSDHPDISKETKDRVKQVAETLNYSVNLHSSLFRNKKSNLIALIVPEINMFYIPNMIKGINKVLEDTKYSLFVFLSKDKLSREKEIIKQCIQWAVEGVLISLSSETKNIDHLESLDLASIKTVVLDKILPTKPIPSVSIDNIDAAFKAVDLLISNGHKKILGIFGNSDLSISKKRIEGFIKAMKNNHLEVNKNHIISINNINELDSILPVILNYDKEITAVFTMSDEILAKTYHHILACGLTIDEDISLISISDGIFPYLTYPKISYIKDSGSKMGKVATNLIIQLIENPNQVVDKNITLSTKLIMLDSVCKQ